MPSGVRRLVSAGAGSGKTYRIVSTVLDRVRAGTPIEHIAALTFTEAAAAELHDRVHAAIISAGLDTEAGRIDPGNFCTIHKFSLGILQRYPLLAGLPPVPLTLTETQAKTLRANAIGAEARAAGSTVRALFSGGLGAGLGLSTTARNDNPRTRLQKAVSDLIEKSASIGMRPDALELEGALAARRISDALARNGDAESLERDFDLAFADISTELDTVDAPKPTNRQLWDALKALRTRRGLTVFDKALETLSHKRTVDLEKRHGALFTAARAIVETHPEGALRIADTVQGVYSVAAAVMRRIERDKSRVGAIDFDDMQSLTLALLTGHRGSIAYAPLVAKALPFIIVDEFQDTSPIQFRLFEALREAGSELTYVGDLKQGIYGFRSADSALFSELLVHAHHHNEPVDTLDRSRRSRPELVDFANALFGKLLPAEGLNFTPLTADNDYSAGKCPKSVASVEVIRGFVSESQSIMNTAIDRAEVLIASGCTVLDRASRSPRPATWGDVAVIARSHSQLNKWATAFRERKISVAREIPDVQSTLEVQLVVAWLRFIASPRDFLAASGVLLSELYGLSQNTVARLSLLRVLGSPRSALALGVSDPEKLPLDDFERSALERCRDDLAACRAAVRAQPLFEALQYCTDRVDFLTRLSLRRDAREVAQVRANLSWVFSKAHELSTASSTALSLLGASGATLENLIVALEPPEEEREQSKQPQPLGEDSQVVRLVTIHSSKGLEYPIVIVDAAETVLDVELPRAMVLRPTEAGAIIAPDLLEKSGVQWVPDVKNDTLRDELRALFDGPAETRREALRLFYVAVTRARDHLFFTWPETKGTSAKDSLRKLVVDRGCAPPLHATTPESPSVWLGTPVVVSIAETTEKTNNSQAPEDLAPWRAVCAQAHTPNTPVENELLHAKRTTFLAKVSPTELCRVADCPEVPRLAKIYPRHSLARTEPEPVSIRELPSTRHERLAVSDDTVSPARLGLLVHSAVERASLTVAPAPGADLELATVVLSRHGQTEHTQALTALIIGTLVALRRAMVELKAIREPAREVPFVIDLGGTTLRGLIDLVVESADGMHIVDLKTHPLPREHLPRWGGYYRPQLDAYALATARITRAPIAGRHLAIPSAGALVSYDNPFDLTAAEDSLIALTHTLASGARGPTRDCTLCGWKKLCARGREVIAARGTTDSTDTPDTTISPTDVAPH